MMVIEKHNKMKILFITVIVFMKGFTQTSYVDALPAYKSIKSGRNIAPMIQLSGNEVELSFGVTWNVTCKSNEPIVWKSYDPWFDWTPPNVDSYAISTGDVDMQYGAVLIITYASAASVGRYYCVTSEKKTEDLAEMVTEDFAVSIQVYVKDVEQPLVPIPTSVYYVQNEEVFIPCKPSYPDVEVELCNKNGQCLAKPDDPTKGFRLSKASLNISEDGMVVCKSDITSYTIHLLPSEKELPDIKKDDHDLQFESIEKQCDTSCCLLMIGCISVLVIFGFIFILEKLFKLVATCSLFKPSKEYEQASTV